MYTQPEYSDEAVHLALALHHAGLISMSTTPTDAADGLLLDQTSSPHQPLLCLPNMLEHYVSSWAKEDGLAALQYLYLLRGPPALTDALAVEVLLRCGVTDVLLNRVPFLPRATQCRLMEACAQRLHADRSMSTHAARLLFECQAYESLAALLLDLLSAALLAAPATNPTQPGPTTGDAASLEANAAQLRADAQTFLSEWRASDSAAAASLGTSLARMLSVAELLLTAAAWRKQRGAHGGGDAALVAMLGQLEALPLLPRAAVEVDAAQAAFGSRRRSSSALHRRSFLRPWRRRTPSLRRYAARVWATPAWAEVRSARAPSCARCVSGPRRSSRLGASRSGSRKWAMRRCRWRRRSSWRAGCRIWREGIYS